MSFQDQQIQDMFSRLSVLERNDVAKTAETRSLEQKTTALQGENSTLKATVGALSTQLETIRKRARKGVKGVEKAVEINREKISALSVNTQVDDLHKRTDYVERRTYSVERRTDYVEIKANSVEEKADSVEKRTTAIERKADLVENSTVLIENRLRNAAQSVTKVWMEGNNPTLITGQFVKLNTWVPLIENVVVVMDTAGDMNVKLDGDYFVGFKWGNWNMDE